MPREKSEPRRLVEAAPITVRVRSHQGMHRVVVQPCASWITFKQIVHEQAGCDENSHFLASDPAGSMRMQAGDLTSVAELEITNGSMVYLVPEQPRVEEAPSKEKRQRKQKAPAKGNDNAADNAERTKRHKKAENQPIGGSFSGMAEFDASILARDYLSAYHSSSTGDLGSALFQQRLAAARIDAVSGGRVVISDSSTGKRLAVSFRDKTSGKSYQEECPLYSQDQIRDVFLAVITKRTTRRRRTATAINESIFTVAEIADRSPPLLWSLYHNSRGDINRGIRTILDEVQQQILRADEDQSIH